ncbi:MAG: hypothetical protein FWD71_05850 [Oscillospiraceae bacterium]|nr:hypothetical protein [Oscillospiraceae bacterium]
MNLVKIKRIAFDEMSEQVMWSGEKGGKYYHGERVAKLALTLKKYILTNDNGDHDDIMTVAAWFHDVAHGGDDHALAGAEKAKIFLADYCTEYEMHEIYDIMYRHDDRISDRDSFSVYAKFQQDADHLDHFGTHNIFTDFLYASIDGRNIVKVIENMKEWQKSLDTKYENELNFDISKKIYREKIKFFRLFLERFSVEGTGGIWNEEIICEGKI